ncbi:IS66 family insertion sequence element accessory protein TnpA, partial [Shewanella xiamenensis]
MNQEQKRAHWATVVEQQKQSTLSIKQFCADSGISYQTFYYWSKRLRSPDATQTLQPIIFNEYEETKAESVIRHSAPKFCNFQCLTAIGHSDLLLSF